MKQNENELNKYKNSIIMNIFKPPHYSVHQNNNNIKIHIFYDYNTNDHKWGTNSGIYQVDTAALFLLR